MKIKLQPLFLFLIPFCVILLGSGCDKEEYYDYYEGYIIGSFIGDEVNEGQATGNKTVRGYCILLEENKNKDNYTMDFYTFNFPDTMFTFPNEILTPNFNGNDCGPIFFPISLKNAYKIKFKYNTVDEQDKVQFINGACLTIGIFFPWENYEEVMMCEISKN